MYVCVVRVLQNEWTVSKLTKPRWLLRDVRKSIGLNFSGGAFCCRLHSLPDFTHGSCIQKKKICLACSEKVLSSHLDTFHVKLTPIITAWIVRCTESMA